MKITEEQCRRVLEVVDKGLSNGLGESRYALNGDVILGVPGKICVEAAVCYAFGEPHGDQPKCVDPYLSKVKIELNDHTYWTSNKARARGLRRLAIAQLGTAGKFDEFKFKKLFFHLCHRFFLIPQLREDAQDNYTNPKLTAVLSMIDKVDQDPRSNDAIHDLALAIAPKGSDSEAMSLLNMDECFDPDWITGESPMVAFCEEVVQILVQMKTPGSKFLHLTAPPQNKIKGKNKG